MLAKNSSSSILLQIFCTARGKKRLHDFLYRSFELIICLKKNPYSKSQSWFRRRALGAVNTRKRLKPGDEDNFGKSNLQPLSRDVSPCNQRIHNSTDDDNGQLLKWSGREAGTESV